MFCLCLVFVVLVVLGRLIWLAAYLYCYCLLGVLLYIGGCASRGSVERCFGLRLLVTVLLIGLCL